MLLRWLVCNIILYVITMGGGCGVGCGGGVGVGVLYNIII